MNTTVVNTTTDRVKAGAEFLDNNVPDWLDRIDLDQLRLESGWHCVLGQLFDGHPKVECCPYHYAQEDRFNLTNDDARGYGFMFSSLDEPDDADELTEAWRQEIERRRSTS